MTNGWKVVYFTEESGRNPVREFVDALQKQQKAKVFRILSHIKEFGLQSVIPHLKKVAGTPLWEIRFLGQDNIRIFYVVPLEKQVLLLHGFSKKRQKTEIKDIDLALRRYTEWKMRLDK